MKKENAKKKAEALSPAQKRAVESFGKDVMVLAGAGSGKTRVLVERFFYAVSVKKIAPENILAITFTEKAANEMRKRLIEQCDGHGLSELRARIERAEIGTLHGFCGSILRDHPIEAGLDPFFRVMNEGEGEILMEKELDALLEEEADSPEWIAMLSDYGEREMRASLKRYYRFTRSMGKPHTVFAAENLDRRTAELKSRIERHAEPLLSAPSLSEGAEAILAVLKKKGPEDRALIEAIGEAAGLLHGRMPKHREDVAIIKESAEGLISIITEKLSRPLKTEFIRVYRRFEERIEATKRELAVCDFDDLLYKAHRLLSGAEPRHQKVREHYRKKFKAIFVDEFQDTSFLEAELLKLIKSEGNLFVVGDKQQSIYGFRHAAPEVLENFEKEMSSACERFSLAENYRSRPGVLSFINGTFEKLMDKSVFMPLEAKGDFKAEKAPCIERLSVLIDKESVKNIEEARIIEAAALAQRIAELVSSGRFRFRDIAVLLRSTTASYLYEKAFLKAGIPFYSVKGKGFYEKKEISDILNFLSVVDAPEEDVPLAAVLRSPLAGISDDALFWLARAVKSDDAPQPLFKALERAESIAEIAPADRERITEFMSLRAALASIKDAVGVQRLIQEIISRTHYDVTVLTSPDGLQRAANLRKLLDMAQSLAHLRSVGVRDFIRFVEAVSEHDALEPEARVDSDSTDTVTISTVHAAKGLEFPCVVVADMGSRRASNQKPAWRFSRVHGMGILLKDADGENLPDYSYVQCEGESGAREEAETRRLLYVAMTRAEERLILSGALTDSEKSEPAWMRLVADTGSLENQSIYNVPPASRTESVSAKKSVVPAPAFLSASDLKKRLSPEPHDYEEVPGVTVTELAARSLPPQEAAPFIEEEPESSLFSEEGEPEVSPKQYGNVFHKCLEWLARSKSVRIPASFFKNAVLDALPQAEKKEIQSAVRVFWEGPWGEALRSAKKLYPELPFIYKTEGGLLKGQIDLVYQDAKGDWNILDYKTGEWTDPMPESYYAHYRTQLALYALIFYKLYGQAPKRGILYYSRSGKTIEFAYTEKDLRRFEEELNRLLFKESFDTMKKGDSSWPK